MTFSQVSPNIIFQMPDRIQACSFSCTLQITAFFVCFLFLHTEGLYPGERGHRRAVVGMEGVDRR